jgi:CRP-like cAMP-binding protein
MDMDWLNTPVDVPISELIARKKRARMIETLRSQLEGSFAPSVQVRLQLADLLVQAGRGAEAVPVLIGLADEFAADGFVAKAIAILKRVEKAHDGGPDVSARIAALVQRQKRAARVVEVDNPPLELGIEEFADETPVEAARAEPPPDRPSAEGEQQAAGVGDRIRGAFKRFLSSLPEPPVAEAPIAETPIAEPPVAEAAEPLPPEPSEDTAPFILVGDDPVAPAEPLAEGPLAAEPLAEEPPPELEITLEPEEAEAAVEPEIEPLPAELSAEAYQEQLLDIVEDVLHRPSGAAVDRPQVVEYAHRLLAMPLFADLSEDELLAVVRGLRVHTFDAGDVIVTEREPGQSLFILTGGRVKVFVRNPVGRNYAVAQLHAGDFFGEISSLSGRPRSATVVAAAATDALELDKPTLDGIARGHPRVCDVLEDAYIRRASSPDVAAIRAVPMTDPLSEQRAIEVLEAHFGESRWDPRMRLRLADVLVRAGKEHDAVPILVGLADDLAREGYPEKAISILKKIEQLQRRNIEEVSLAAFSKQGGAEPHPPEAPPAIPAPSPKRWRARTEDFLHTWLVDTVRDSVGRSRAAAGGAAPIGKALQGYGPGLRSSPLFEGFEEDELVAFIQGLRLLTFAAGDVIVTEGEPGQSVFLLASGAVKVFVRSPAGHDVSVCTLREGSFFGEMSTLSGQPRSATVTAAGPCDLLELDRAALDRIAGTHPRVRAVLEDFSRRRAADPAAAAARRPQ